MYTSLVICGGGAKTITSLGMLGKMHLEGELKDIKTISCCSAGSYIAVLYLLGVSFIEMLNFIPQETINVDFDRLMKISERKGLFRIKKFTKKFKQFVREKLQKKNPTLLDLHNYTGINLFIAVTDITNNQEIHLNHVSYPDYPLLESVYASSSFPLVFVPVRINSIKYTDGGVISSCPLKPVMSENTIIVDCYNDVESSGLLNYCMGLLRIGQTVRKKSDLENFQGKYILVKSNLGLLDFGDTLKNTKEFFNGWNQFS